MANDSDLDRVAVAADLPKSVAFPDPTVANSAPACRVSANEVLPRVCHVAVRTRSGDLPVNEDALEPLPSSDETASSDASGSSFDECLGEVVRTLGSERRYGTIEEFDPVSGMYTFVDDVTGEDFSVEHEEFECSAARWHTNARTCRAGTAHMDRGIGGGNARAHGGPP